MKKFLVQGTISIMLFFAVFFIFSRVDWVQLFQPHEHITEKKLGSWFWNIYSSDAEVIEDKNILLPLDSILTRVCEANHINRATIKMHVVKEDEVNAFACPGNHLVIYSSLLASCKNEMELCGVIAHEVAHIEKKHVMKKLKKEIGMTVLFSMMAGDGSRIMELVKVLSSTAYDRSYETEADKIAVEYLQNANVDPKHLGVFLIRLSQDKEIANLTEWIATHPDAQKRNKAIIALQDNSKKEIIPKPILHASTWNFLKNTAYYGEETLYDNVGVIEEMDEITDEPITDEQL